MISYIIKALQDSNTVYVNDLGTFTVQYVPASIVEDTIQPPCNKVVFDSTIHHDEMAFTNLVCREKQCLITQANLQIMQWVDELKAALANNKSVTYEDFGTFSLNEKGKLSFECERVDALNQEFEGMCVLNLSATFAADVSDEDIPDADASEERLRAAEEEARLQREAEERLRAAEEEARLQHEAEERLRAAEEEARLQREAEERLRAAEEEARLQREAEERLRAAEEEARLQREAEERQRAAEEEVRLQREAEERQRAAILQEKTEDEEEEDEERDEERDEDIQDVKPKKRHLGWLFVLLIVIALAVLGYLFRGQLGRTYQNVMQKMKKAPNTEVVEDTADDVDESTAEPAEVEPQEPVEEIPTVYEPKVVKTTADGKYNYVQFESGHYYAIAGSLPTEKDAELHIMQRRLEQYSPMLVLQDGVSNIRVCVGVFDTEAEAESFAKGLNEKYWVLK